ncbi:hypothetical protein Pyrfu_1169 [Pyrolobus fumarii 1A]|uniref:Uncharacterized protein n=1 Tax=Pyrolobus fumarii (strain DSM 11204 / 1A) TaxID=694429 RepID=G0EFK8_PYRF1|nr:hypothetical protein [Pyrolobus fumarii]AEM39032.1 hypothetical protein Pyrfu_1169 [Pyrolobus fumarii 1A]
MNSWAKCLGSISSGFYGKRGRGLLPGPLDPEIHGDFMIWYGLIEELCRVRGEF